VHTSVIEKLATQSRWVVLAVGLVLAVVVGLVDYLTGPELSISILYLLPVSLTTYAAGLSTGVIASVVSAVFWFAADALAGAHYSHWWIPYWNAGVRLGFFLTVTALLGALVRELRREQEMARMDPLTEVLNSRGFREILDMELIRAERYDRPLTLAYFDVDGFKTVNDTMGHGEGDTCLRLIATTVRHHLRAADVVGRLGGDEFAVLLPETTTESAARVVEKLRQVLLAGVRHAGYPVTFSIGIASRGDGRMTVDDLLGRADALMYKAKKSRTHVAGAPARPSA